MAYSGRYVKKYGKTMTIKTLRPRLFSRGRSLSIKYLLFKKPRRVSVAHDGNKMQFVIFGDMRIENDTYHGGCG